MPKYSPSAEEMDESYASPKVAAPSKETAPKPSVDEESAGATEILIAKNKLPPGCKVGDSYEFKVTQDFGDEASLELVSKSKGEETETEEPMSTEGQELAALSQESA